MASIVVTVTHTHPLETDVFSVLDYADLRAVQAPDGLLRVAARG
jgi:sugar-phosphatase